MKLIDASKIKFKRCWISKGYNKGCDNHLIAFAEQIKTIPTFDLDKHDSEIRADERRKCGEELLKVINEKPYGTEKNNLWLISQIRHFCFGVPRICDEKEKK